MTYRTRKPHNGTFHISHYSPTLQSAKKKNMEKENIKTVGIADFKNNEHVLDYVDNDFVIINSLEGGPYNSDDTIRLGCFLIAVCLEGCIQLQNLPTGSGRPAARTSQHHYQPCNGKPEA